MEMGDRMNEATFTIKWDESLGPKWMNIDNLKSCLFSPNCISGSAKVEVNEARQVNQSMQEGK